MKRYIVISFLLSIKFLLISCNDNSSYITYSINWIDNGSLKLTLINNSKNDYYFAFKSLEQPNNPGPYYSSFSVLKIEEKVNLDSLRNLAFQNYLLSNKTNGFDSSSPPGLDVLNKKKSLRDLFSLFLQNLKHKLFLMST